MAAGSPVELRSLSGTALKARAPSNVFAILTNVGTLGYKAIVEKNPKIAEWIRKEKETIRFRGTGELDKIADKMVRAVGLAGDNTKGDKSAIWEQCREFMTSIETGVCELQETERELRAGLLECAAAGIERWVKDKGAQGDEITKPIVRKQKKTIGQMAFPAMEKLPDLLRRMAAEERDNPKKPSTALGYWYYQFSNMLRVIDLADLGGLVGVDVGGGTAEPHLDGYGGGGQAEPQSEGAAGGGAANLGGGTLVPEFTPALPELTGMPALPEVTDLVPADEDEYDIAGLLPGLDGPNDFGGHPPETDEDQEPGSKAKRSRLDGHDTTARIPWGQGLSWYGDSQGDSMLP